MKKQTKESENVLTNGRELCFIKEYQPHAKLQLHLQLIVPHIT
jgi:hypothetical protein